MKEEENDKNLQEKKSSNKSVFKRLAKDWKISFILILILILVGMYLFNHYKTNKIESDFEDQKKELEAKYEQKNDVKALQMRESYEKSQKELLKSVLQLFTWILEREIPEKNPEKIKSLCQQLVRNSSFSDIIIADPLDKVAITTNARYEGLRLSDIFIYNYIQIKSPIIIKDPEKDILYAIGPVFMGQKKVATIVILYKQ